MRINDSGTATTSIRVAERASEPTPSTTPGTTSTDVPSLTEGDLVGDYQSKPSATSGHAHGSGPVQELHVEKILGTYDDLASANHQLQQLSDGRGDENLAIVRATADPTSLVASSQYHVVRLDIAVDEGRADEVYLSKEAATGVSILALGDGKSFAETTLGYVDDTPVVFGGGDDDAEGAESETTAAPTGTSVNQIVDGVLSLYDGNSDDTITYKAGGKHGLSGEALRRQEAIHTSPDGGPVVRTKDTMAITSLVIAADGLDGAMNGSVSRMDLMSVVGAFDLTGGSDNGLGDEVLDHSELTAYERLFRERTVDIKQLEVLQEAQPGGIVGGIPDSTDDED